MLAIFIDVFAYYSNGNIQLSFQVEISSNLSSKGYDLLLAITELISGDKFFRTWVEIYTGPIKKKK